MQDQFSLLAMFMKGWYATYPLIAISVICVTIIFERIWALWGLGRRATRLAERMIGPLRQGKFADALAVVRSRRGPSERVFEELVSEAESAPRQRLEEIDEERRFAELLQLRGLIWVLATSGASAPFIGLFGTVVGILAAFQSMAIMGTGGFSVVAAGISEALISTALGLIVAIIAVIFYNYFSQRIERINATIHICAARLIDAAEQVGEPMAISTPRSEGGMFWEINITPLTDIFLVLLIIFMVTASVAVESATHVNLPVAANTSPENKGVLVTYTANHELFVNSKDVPEGDVEAELHHALARVDAKVVIFQGDRTVLLGDMVRILDLAKAAGAQQIAIAARRAAPGERPG